MFALAFGATRLTLVTTSQQLAPMRNQRPTRVDNRENCPGASGGLNLTAPACALEKTGHMVTPASLRVVHS